MSTNEEAASLLYAKLQKVATLRPAYRPMYRLMNRVFLRCLDQQTAFQGIRFGGPFAKTDYLLREHQADRHLQHIVNDARVRFRKAASLSEEELKTWWAQDLKALALFVALLYQSPVPSFLEVLFPSEQHEKGLLPVTDCLRVIVERVEEKGVIVTADWDGPEELLLCLDANEYSPYQWDWGYLRAFLQKGTQLNLVNPRILEAKKARNGAGQEEEQTASERENRSTQDQGPEGLSTVFPELVILEPDYLVDISAVAACFESYATSPLIHLLNKIKPSAQTPAIVLGNLASQFLDEEICDFAAEDEMGKVGEMGEMSEMGRMGEVKTAPRSYAESIKTFFQRNALTILTTPLPRDFHQQAQVQQQNIRLAIRNGLSKHVQNFHARDVMVEPSFFSEMLGLQGRMDFLQLDQRLLIEQKSGKGGFPQLDPDTPVAQQKHYVQMLLYSALLRYNYRQQYKKNNFGLSAFLLYSKYVNGLISQGYAPQLVFDALRVRNGIVANEYRFTHGDIQILASLTPDILNENHITGTLWTNYQRPQIEALLAPIHTATALERAYYFRFLTFLETEHLLAKVGTQTKENSGFADKWYSTLEVKRQAGNIYDDLELLSPKASDKGKVDTLVLRLPASEDNEVANFRKGDIVVLYPYEEGEEPDACRTMVFRCTIEEIGEQTITLSLRAMQTDVHVFWYRKGCRWAIEHDLFESSFGGLYRGMHAFLSAPQERKDLILLQRRPKVDSSRTLKGDYGTFNELALRVKQGQDLFLIIGPPGTGKTSFGLLTTLQEELLEPDSSVLLMAYTNRAVDEICSKLVEQGIDFIRIGGRYACERAYLPYLLENKMAGCTHVSQLNEVVQQTRVFVGTTTSLSSNAALFQVRTFDLAIIDEASQILEPQLMALLSATGMVSDGQDGRDGQDGQDGRDGLPAIRKLVMIGDHKQLPAVVQQDSKDSRVEDESLRAILLTDCRLSLFERLLKAYRDDPQVVYMLTRQGRMHHDIADFPNRTFYEGLLKEVPLPHQLQALPGSLGNLGALGNMGALGNLGSLGNMGALGDMEDPENPVFPAIDAMMRSTRVAFVSVPPVEDAPSDKVNANEAAAIAAVAACIYHEKTTTFALAQQALRNIGHAQQACGGFDPEQTLGIIVPYRNQIAAVRKAMNAYHIPQLREVTVDTVERFQGSQRDYILYGFTVQQPYQLSFLTDHVFEENGHLIDRKLNVAMTRAREHLLLFGHAPLLEREPVFHQLIDYLRQQDCLFDSTFRMGSQG